MADRMGGKAEMWGIYFECGLGAHLNIALPHSLGLAGTGPLKMQISWISCPDFLIEGLVTCDH